MSFAEIKPPLMQILLCANGCGRRSPPFPVEIMGPDTTWHCGCGVGAERDELKETLRLVWAETEKAGPPDLAFRVRALVGQRHPDVAGGR